MKNLKEDNFDKDYTDLILMGYISFINRKNIFRRY